MNKKRLTTLLVTCLAAIGLQAENINITTPNTSLIVDATVGKDLKFVYYGTRLNDADAKTVADVEDHYYSAYPAYGFNCAAEPCLAVRHADGDMTLQLEVTGTETRQESNATVKVVKMKDKKMPFFVNVCYRTYNDVDIIETWTEITNQEKKTVALQRYYSGCLPIRRGNVWVSHFYGSWANEGRLSEEPLKPGMIVIENKDGVRNSHTSHGEVMLSLDGKGRENEGDVIGAAICYTGNYKLRINTHDDESHQLFAGINEDASEYHLKKGETFTTPVLALTYSREGKSGVSRNFHRWGRNYQLAHGTKVRDILLNSWEGVYFDINEEGMDQMMADIASMGGELFVMDDGWFGEKYPRKTDNSSLGDWAVDKTKLPNGIGGLLKDAKKHGIKFGIWLEPEMTNNPSELYEKHPDWVVKAPGRDLLYGRGGTQLVLDMCNPKVQDFVFNTIDNLMTNYPDIYYIKWDANFEIHNFGSHYLSADNQSHLYVDYHLGLKKTLERIRAKYPDLVIQCCASGGGRVNYGLMPYFEEFWVSDNTDAQQRLFIQWGTSMFFPSCAMAQHVSASPNHQTGRVIPLKFRFDVAMTGRLGMEMKPSDLNEKETEFARKAVQTYKDIRPIIQQGNLYRILSPYDKTGFCSEMFITDDKSEAVFFAYKFEQYVDLFRPRFHFAGLDPNATYELTELNRQGGADHWEGKRITGTFLMKQGIEIALNGQFASKVIKLKKI